MSKLSISGLGGIPQTLGQCTVPTGHILRIEGALYNTSTGAFQLPAGTTAERPASPGAGYFRWNTSDLKLEIYNGSGWTQYATSGGGGGSVSSLGLTSATASSPLQFYKQHLDLLMVSTGSIMDLVHIKYIV